jgi:long-chain acyl-CoA synthetase
MTIMRAADERPDYSKIEKRAPSVAQMFLDRVAATPQAEAFRYPRGDGWESVTWQQVNDRVQRIAAGLISLGIAPEDRVALASATRDEWVLVDFAVLCAGAATTTVYPTTNAGDVAYIVANSGSRVVVAEDQAQVDKLIERRAGLPDVQKVVIIDGTGDGDWVITLDQLEQRGKQVLADTPHVVEDRVHAIRPEHLASIIYTSGTTARPKGVRLTHAAWTYTAAAIDSANILRPDDVNYLWLPLAHSFGKVLQAAQIRIGFPTAIDGRIEKIVDNLAVVKPTFVAAVPRIFEKVHNRVVQGAKEGGGLKYKIFRWAFKIGAQWSSLVQEGKKPGFWLAFRYRLATKLVFSKLQARFGGRLKYFISGSAPLARDLAEFFHAANVLILEGYGLTESSAATFVNRPESYRFGTVGLPMPGTEVKIAEDGEILIKGRGIMRGYHNLPQATAEALTDRWLHTGDIGQIEPGGFLRITDRKKDLIKTSGGKYVAPQAIEGKLKAICPWVSQVVVHGDNRNYCSALVTLDEEAVKKWAAEHGKGGAAIAQLAEDPGVRALVQGGIDELNTSLASWETIKKFTILPAELTVESGELTPSLKVKRKAVETRYKALLDGMYVGTRVE